MDKRILFETNEWFTLEEIDNLKLLMEIQETTDRWKKGEYQYDNIIVEIDDDGEIIVKGKVQ